MPDAPTREEGHPCDGGFPSSGSSVRPNRAARPGGHPPSDGHTIARSSLAREVSERRPRQPRKGGHARGRSLASHCLEFLALASPGGLRKQVGEKGEAGPGGSSEHVDGGEVRRPESSREGRTARPGLSHPGDWVQFPAHALTQEVEMTSTQIMRAVETYLRNFDVLAQVADDLRFAVYVDPDDADGKDPRVSREILERFKDVLRDLSLVASGRQPAHGTGIEQWRQ